MERRTTMHRSKNRKVNLDEIDIFINNKQSELEAVSMLSLNIPTPATTDYSYWKSTEAYKLFEPKEDEEVLHCLSRRIGILNFSFYDDETLLKLVSNVKDINDISTSQRNYLRHQCLYLRKSYKTAVQRMNTST